MSEEASNQEEMIRQLMMRVDRLEANAPGNNLTLGVMSGNLDYTMAAFTVALGAAAYDMQVDMFFTFWAVPALRDPQKKVKKGFLDTFFGAVLPSSAKKLPISKMQMLGMGPPIINKVIKMHHGKTLEDLIKEAIEFGVRIHVCTMSLEVMGIRKEELIDYPNLNFAGVGTFVDLFQNSRQCWFM